MSYAAHVIALSSTGLWLCGRVSVVFCIVLESDPQSYLCRRMKVQKELGEAQTTLQRFDEW
jgi:hypothetical protein